MRVGIQTLLANVGRERADLEVYRQEVRLLTMAEAMGFDSIWGVEHHFSDYAMCPDVIQLLTYLAARTERAELGTMVVVLPWHDPLRVVEQIAMLDNLSEGRVVLGMGRGLSKHEFDGFRVPMDTTRQRFVESARVIMQSLETGVCEFEGEIIRQPRREIRPEPFKSFVDRTYFAAVSPESLQVAAECGVGLLLVPQKPWEQVEQELRSYRSQFQELQGREAPAPTVTPLAFVDEDPARAREMAQKFLGDHYQTVMRHYGFADKNFGAAKGYEFYRKMGERLQKHGTEEFSTFFADLQVYGTPDQVLEKLEAIQAVTGCDRFVMGFSYGGLSYEEVERSQRLFAEAVLPRVKSLVPA